MKKKFNIEVFYDETLMEVKNIGFSNKFIKLHSFDKADLLLDVIVKFWKIKDQNMNKYFKEIKRKNKNDRQKKIFSTKF